MASEIPWVTQAREELEDKLDGWLSHLLPLSLREALALNCDLITKHAAIYATVGVGKTHSVLQALPTWMRRRKEAEKPWRVLYLVPHHKLSRELEQRAKRAGLSVAIFLGRDAQITDESGVKMCCNTKAVNDAIRVGADVNRAACGPAKSDPKKPRCTYRDECAFWQQIEKAGNADVVIASHEYLFHSLPQQVSHDLGLVITDESWWQNGLQIPKPMPNSERISHSLTIGGFAQHVMDHPGELNDPTPLYEISVKLERALNYPAVGEEFPLRAIERAGITLAEIELAIDLESKRKIEDKLNPGLSAERWNQEIERAKVNPVILLRLALWKRARWLVKTQARVTGLVVIGQDRAGSRVAKIFARRRVRWNVVKLPLLLLDATLEVSTVLPYLPGLSVVANIDIKAPYQRNVLVTGRPASGTRKQGLFVKSTLTPPKEPGVERDRVLRVLRKIETFVLARDGVLITHEDLLKYFSRMPSERKLHFNGLTGLDQDGFKTARSLVILSRPLPRESDLADIARALTGESVIRESCEKIPTALLTKDGKKHELRTLFYRPDILNTLHSGIVLAQLIQAAGRGRGVNRSESEPLDVFIFGSDSIPPLEFDEMRRWDEIEPDILADMVYEGLVMTSPADTLKMLRQLFENGATVDAARMAMRRAGITPDLANIPPIYISYGECSPNAQGWRRVKYRPVGRGQQTRIAFAHPSRLATLKADLESALGPLAVFDGYRSR